MDGWTKEVNAIGASAIVSRHRRIGHHRAECDRLDIEREQVEEEVVVGPRGALKVLRGGGCGRG